MVITKVTTGCGINEETMEVDNENGKTFTFFVYTGKRVPKLVGVFTRTDLENMLKLAPYEERRLCISGSEELKELAYL
jgi:hypothetical protein